MRKIICILLALGLLAVSAVSEPATGQWDSIARIERNEDLFLVCRGGLWGMADAEGSIVLKPQFDRMPEFDGRFAVAMVENPLYNAEGLSDSMDTGYIYGLIDCEGEIVIPVIYDGLEIVENTTLVEVRVGTRSGFMNLQGEDVTGLKYDSISRLDDEYSAVRDAETRLWGVYYHAGREIIPCEYDSFESLNGSSRFMNVPGQVVEMYKDGEAEVRFQLSNGKVINLTEAQRQAAEAEARALGVAIPEGCDQLSRIPGSVNLLARRGELWGMMAPDGSMILDFQFDAQPEFKGSWAIVSVYDPSPREGFSGEPVYGSFYGVIDKDGRFLLDPEYDEVKQSEDGGMVRFALGGVYRFMNLETGKKLPGSYDRAGEFVGDYAAVGMLDPQADDNLSAPEAVHWGTIDRSGKTGIPMDYAFMEMGEGNIAMVKLGSLYGYVHADGSEITRCKYANASPFKNGLAPVAVVAEGTSGWSDDSRAYAWGAIDETGEEIIPCIYDELEVLENGLLRIGVDGLYGLANAEGEVLVKPRYFRILDFEGDYAVVGVRVLKPEAEQVPSDEYDIFWGVVDGEGREILPPEYSSAGFTDDGLIVAGLATGERLYFEVRDGEAVQLDGFSMAD